MDPGWILELAAVRCIFVAFYVLLGFHLWVKRGYFASLAAAAVGLARFASAPFRKPLAEPARSSKEDKWVKARMDELRVRSFKLGMELLSVGCVARMLLMTFRGHSFTDRFGQLGFALLLAFTALLYACSMMFSCGLLQATPDRMRLTYVAGSALQLAQLWATEPSIFFYQIKVLRALPNTVMAVAVLDKRIAWPVNLLWLLVMVRHEVCKQSQLDVLSPLGAKPWLAVVIADVMVALTILGLSWIAEAVAESYVRLNYGVVTTRNVQDAMLRLLSVLCDGALELASDLAIVDPSARVAHLLAPDEGAAGAARVQGRHIVDFVAEHDKERLSSFLAGGAGAEGGVGGGGGSSPGGSSVAALPRSLQVQLVDSAGRDFPAEIFHAALPRVEGGGLPLGHLLGVRECAPAQREASIAAEPRGPTLGPVFRPRARDPSSASSSTAPSAPASVYVQHRQDLPELEQIEMRFDPLDHSLAIKEARFLFRSGPGADNAAQLPRLLDFVADGMQFRAWQWIQEKVHDETFDTDNARPLPVLPLVWPGRSGQPLLLESAQVELDFDNPGTASDEEQDDEGALEDRNNQDDRVDAVLQLRSFTQIAMVRQRRHHHHNQRHHHGHRSSDGGRAARSGRSRVQSEVGLPSVAEADAWSDAGTGSAAAL